MKIQHIGLIIFLLIISFTVGLFASTYPFNIIIYPMVKDKTTNYKEKDYVNAYCKGQIEYRLPDRTRVDCLTDEYAIEFDWGYKWAESIGQSLYYAKMTGKKPAVGLILKSPKDIRYIERINKVDKNIKVFKIKAYREQS